MHMPAQGSPPSPDPAWMNEDTQCFASAEPPFGRGGISLLAQFLSEARTQEQAASNETHGGARNVES